MARSQTGRDGVDEDREGAPTWARKHEDEEEEEEEYMSSPIACEIVHSFGKYLHPFLTRSENDGHGSSN